MPHNRTPEIVNMPKKIIVLLFLVSPILNMASSKDTLRVGYNLEPPFVVELQNNRLSGPSVWLWENIANDNDIQYKYIALPFEELLSGLEKDKIDVSLSPLTITAERSQVIDFTSPYHIAHASILQNEVTPIQKSWQFVKSFFSVNFMRALGALAFVILIFGILIWVFERNKNHEEFDNSIKGVWEGFWWSAVTMTTVGYGDKSPRTTGGRIISLIWMFTAIIIISGFTASIASSLTVNNISSSNGKIDDFKNKTVGTITNSVTSEWMRNNFFTNKKEFQTMEELLNALDQEKIEAIAHDRPALQAIVNNDTLSKYDLIDIKYNPQFYAFGLSKQLPDSLSQAINYSMLYNIEKMDWKVLLSESGLE
ncbi:transporter substrate-binding domain-containing protein [Flagellimonas sp.]|uniref:transporter substrate-binding domain-containing protein n=1 Tax=Flagellimonas sp. TaxID=2058762 RepID=UPI003BA9F71C